MKTILVTGANRGLGLGFTGHYLERGYRVFACARDWSRFEDSTDLPGRFGGRFRPLDLDLGDEHSISALPGLLDGTKLDIVINNAGILHDEPFGRWTAEAFMDSLSVNCIGPALIAQALFPSMSSGSKLVNLSSGLASMGLNINPETGMDAYAASKAALNMVTHRLSSKQEAEGVIVVALDPGWVKTRMGGAEAELTVAESIDAITGTIENVTLADTGQFLNRYGESIPW